MKFCRPGGDNYEFDKCGLELEGATAGLIGFGAIGSRVARMLSGFDCRVLVYDPYVDPETLRGVAEPASLTNL
jgi:D-3-phosphoglycerate dehydrogenase / 2-oxoglutarate reductase